MLVLLLVLLLLLLFLSPVLLLVMLVLLHDKAADVVPLAEEGLHFNRLQERRSVVTVRDS